MAAWGTKRMWDVVVSKAAQHAVRLLALLSGLSCSSSGWKPDSRPPKLLIAYFLFGIARFLGNLEIRFELCLLANYLFTHFVTGKYPL